MKKTIQKGGCTLKRFYRICNDGKCNEVIGVVKLDDYLKGGNSAVLPEKDLRELRERYDLLENEDLTGKFTSPLKNPVSRISRAQKTGKEECLYDHREWCASSLKFLFIGVPLVMLLLSVLMPDGRLAFYIMAIVFPLLLFSDASLRVVISDSKIMIHQGFFLMKRVIFYDDIVEIAFKSGSKYAQLGMSAGRTTKHFSPGLNNPKLFFILRDDDYFIISGSKHMEDILAAIKKARPHLKID